MIHSDIAREHKSADKKETARYEKEIMRFEYAEQPEPKGIAQALLIGESFLAGEPSCLILGDNIFYGHGLAQSLQAVSARETGATIFAYHVRDPQRYGGVQLLSR